MSMKARLDRWLAVPFLMIILQGGCGGGGSPTRGLQFADVSGEWNRVPAVQEDACAIAGLLNLNAPTIMRFTQADTALLAEQQAPHGEFPAFAGTGTASGNLVTITYDYHVDLDLGASGHCDINVHLVDAGTVSGDKIEGIAQTAVSYEGDNFLACSYFDGCSVGAGFSASR